MSCQLLINILDLTSVIDESCIFFVESLMLNLNRTNLARGSSIQTPLPVAEFLTISDSGTVQILRILIPIFNSTNGCVEKLRVSKLVSRALSKFSFNDITFLIKRH